MSVAIEPTTAPAYIETLPLEILRRILLYAKAYDASDSPLDPPLSIYRSQVSKRWRTVALSCSELWNSWPRYLWSEYWTRICYERSLGIPLDLRIIIDENTMHASAAENRQLAIGEISRARRLIVELDGYTKEPELRSVFEDVVAAMSTSDVPWLEELSLQLTNNFAFDSPSFISVSLFNGNPPPRMHTAIIRDFEFRHTDRIWPESLRILDMRGACAWITIDQMVEFFNAVPNLEELTYQYDDIHRQYTTRSAGLVSYTRSAIHPIRCAALPRLKRFRLVGIDHDTGEREFAGFVPGIFVFSYLSLSPIVELDMGADLLCPDCWEREWDSLEDVGFLTSPYADSFALGMEALRAHFTDGTSQGQSYDMLTVEDRVIKPDMALQESLSTMLPSALRFVLPHVNYQGRRGKVPRVAYTMYLSLPVFSGATELNITRSGHHSPLLSQFPTFPSVRTLSLARMAVKDFVQPPRFSTYAERFPELETIRFIDFSCGGDVVLSSLQVPGEVTNYDTLVEYDVALLDTLIACDVAGVCSSLKRIEFVRCANGEGVVQRMREDGRLRRFHQRVVVTCENSEGYKPLEILA